MARNCNWTTIIASQFLWATLSNDGEATYFKKFVADLASRPSVEAVSLHGLFLERVEKFHVLRSFRISTPGDESFLFLVCFRFVFLWLQVLIFDAYERELPKSGRLTLLMKIQRYLYIHTPPLSWICDRARLLVENGCSVLWLHGSACGRPQCPGLRFQQTPKNETSTFFGKVFQLWIG